MPESYEDRNPQMGVARTQGGTTLVDVVAKESSPMAAATQVVVVDRSKADAGGRCCGRLR